MPYYDYVCTECSHYIKDMRKAITEPHPTTCPACNKETLTQSYEGHAPFVEFKGKHWKEAGGGRGRF